MVRSRGASGPEPGGGGRQRRARSRGPRRGDPSMRGDPPMRGELPGGPGPRGRLTGFPGAGRPGGRGPASPGVGGEAPGVAAPGVAAPGAAASGGTPARADASTEGLPAAGAAAPLGLVAGAELVAAPRGAGAEAAAGARGEETPDPATGGRGEAPVPPAARPSDEAPLQVPAEAAPPLAAPETVIGAVVQGPEGEPSGTVGDGPAGETAPLPGGRTEGLVPATERPAGEARVEAGLPGAAEVAVAAEALLAEADTPGDGPRAGDGALATPATWVDRGEPLSFAQACAALSLSAYVLRRLLDDFEDVLPPLVEGRGERLVPASALEVLAALATWRAEGLDADELRRRALEMRGAAAGDLPATEAEAEGGPVAQRLVEQVARLEEAISRQDERQAEDRDRLLTALMRTNQELQSLRYDLAAGRARRERRKGLWGRLFG